MTDKDFFKQLVELLKTRLKLKVDEVPLDPSIVAEHGSYYNEDTWFAAAIRNPMTNKSIVIIEVHGDNVPVLSVELESTGFAVSEIIRAVKNVYPHFELTVPFFHERTGKLYYGEEAVAQYTTAQASKIVVPEMKNGKGPRFN